MRDTTLVIAVDKAHLQELRLSAPTWFRHWKELNKCPLLVFTDETERPEWWAKQMGEFMSHPDVTIVPWPAMPGVDQRTRMISAFVHGVAEHCETEWHLKIDTDTACMTRDERCFPDEWFDEGQVFISQKWGYSKPAAKHLALVEWAKGVSAFDGTPEAPATWDGDPDKVKCFHKRIMSFVFLGRTEFIKEVSGLCHDCGPAIPGGSHDGLVWYVATRLRRKWLRTNMSKLGWAHGARRLEKQCQEAMK